MKADVPRSLTAKATYRTLVDLLRFRADQETRNSGYIFLANGSSPEGYLTFSELDIRARAWATWLAARRAYGERVLLLFPPGLQYIEAFFGCLYAGAIAVPAYPPSQFGRRQRGRKRFESILNDATVSFILTSGSDVEDTTKLLAECGRSRQIEVGVPEHLDPGLADNWKEPNLKPETIAFLQYTSGSTDVPKGVVVTHKNLLANERMIQTACTHNEQSTFVGWLPLYHDMGLVGNVLQPLYIGTLCILLPPAAFLQKPLCWLDAISRYRAHTSGGPNFAYELCSRRIGPADRARLDLSSWRVAFNGAEPVHAETMNRFAEIFAECGFQKKSLFPCYGLAEATLIVSGGPKGRDFRVAATDTHALQESAVAPAESEASGFGFVGSGTAVIGTAIRIVDPETLVECPDSKTGEIWVSSPSVASGYWGKAELSERTFHASIPGMKKRTFLRTGDLGFVRDGELFVTGRLKDLIIIRGQNHHPEDIEWTVQQAVPSLPLGNVAAFSVDRNREEQVVLLIEADRSSRRNPRALADVARQSVAELHGLQVNSVLVVKTGGIARTSSGKIQRHICREMYLGGKLEIVEASIITREVSAIEPVLVTREELLSLDESGRRQLLQAYSTSAVASILQRSDVDPDVSMPSLGLDSVGAFELKKKVQSDFQIDIPVSELLGDLSPRGVTAWILEHLNSPVDELVESSSLAGTFPLSVGQRALWFLHQVAPENPAYNIARAMRVCSQLNKAALRSALDAVTAVHPLLRATFHGSAEGPVQSIVMGMSVPIEEVDISECREEELQDFLVKRAEQPFDLGSGPALRVVLFHDLRGHQILLFVIHHIVADLWSLALIFQQLATVYQAECSGQATALTGPAVAYSSYVEWQQKLLDGPAGQQLAAYWEERLSHQLLASRLTACFQPPSSHSGKGQVEDFEFGPDLSLQLRSVAQECGVTVFTFLLTVFYVMISRYTSREEVLVGAVVNGRTKTEFESIVGYLPNMLALQAHVSPVLAFADLVKAVHRQVCRDFDYQDYPFALLVEKLRLAGHNTHLPLLDSVFVFQKGAFQGGAWIGALAIEKHGATGNLGGLELELIRLARTSVQFEFSVMVAELEDFVARFEGNAASLSQSQMHRLLGHYVTLLENAICAPETAVGQLQMMPQYERRQVLEEWNISESIHVGTCRSMVELLEQFSNWPDRIALAGNDGQFSYKGLHQRANQLAHYLRELGVRPEVRVGICLERSTQMILAVLGTLTAGGVYVPLDPEYPAARLEYIIKDAGIEVLLTEKRLAGSLPKMHGIDFVILDVSTRKFHSYNTHQPESGVHPENAAYVIYTSGSTGVPKGVTIEHRNAVALIHWAHCAFSEHEMAGVLSATSICFDLSVFEIFAPLSAGGTVILAKNALELPSLEERNRVYLLNTVPSSAELLSRSNGMPENVQTICLAGEPLHFDLVSRLYKGGAARVLDLYGPSETTTYSTFAIRSINGPETIGRAIENTQVYVLDQDLNPLPVGIKGEIFIAGKGVTRGYLNRPDLTALRYLPNPYPITAGERIYRTGDLARWRSDATLEFFGRIDRQVKLRGYRIELGEIETAMRDDSSVLDCVAVVRKDGDEQRLVAYTVLKENCNELEARTKRRLREHLRKRLPEYMVPGAIVLVTALPLNSNGKVDLEKLPQVQPADFGIPVMARTALATSLERFLAQAWGRVLKFENVGADDNFFELGGHSLLATELAWEIQEFFPLAKPFLALLIENPTVSTLAAAITRHTVPDVDPEKIARLCLELQDLTEDEVAERLKESHYA